MVPILITDDENLQILCRRSILLAGQQDLVRIRLWGENALCLPSGHHQHHHHHHHFHDHLLHHQTPPASPWFMLSRVSPTVSPSWRISKPACSQRPPTNPAAAQATAPKTSPSFTTTTSSPAPQAASWGLPSVPLPSILCPQLLLWRSARLLPCSRSSPVIPSNERDDLPNLNYCVKKGFTGIKDRKQRLLTKPALAQCHNVSLQSFWALIIAEIQFSKNRKLMGTFKARITERKKTDLGTLSSGYGHYLYWYLRQATASVVIMSWSYQSSQMSIFSTNSQVKVISVLGVGDQLTVSQVRLSLNRKHSSLRTAITI